MPPDNKFRVTHFDEASLKMIRKVIMNEMKRTRNFPDSNINDTYDRTPEIYVGMVSTAIPACTQADGSAVPNEVGDLYRLTIADHDDDDSITIDKYEDAVPNTLTRPIYNISETELPADKFFLAIKHKSGKWIGVPAPVPYSFMFVGTLDTAITDATTSVDVSVTKSDHPDINVSSTISVKNYCQDSADIGAKVICQAFADNTAEAYIIKVQCPA